MNVVISRLRSLVYPSVRLGVAVLTLALGVVPARAQTPPLDILPEELRTPPADAERSETGLASVRLTQGRTGATASVTDVVTVQYSGWGGDGRLFDSSFARGAAATFPLDGVMPGLQECVTLMTFGESRRCWIPQNIAYGGQAGRPTGTVVFDLQLIEARRNPLHPPPDVAAPPADAMRTPSGLAYKIIRPGTGVRKPSQFNMVTVHYSGWTTNGRMFDSSVPKGAPATFGLGDVIAGWTEGVPLMVEGETMRFWIPEDLAYKGEGDGPRGLLVFEIELVSIQ